MNKGAQDDPAAALAFGPFRLALGPKLLLRGEEQVRLGGRALDLLIALLDGAGEVLSRAELEARVWPRTIVEDSSLRVHIGALRKSLGDGVDGARYIANVPGRGYSFVAPVRRVPLTDAATHAATATTAPVSNLPARLTSIIGRDDTVALLAAALPLQRLTTIVGHGGIGKTSLALAVAGELRGHYPDGVCFVDLAPLSEPWDVADALALALDLPLSGDSALVKLDAYLRTRRLLVILDNCEHLLDAAVALLDRIMKHAPGVDVLATSREPLDAEGEWVHRLAPLASPPADAALSCAGALAFPALRLLVERATASQDSFELNDANLAEAAALCRRLDGVPLALEFVAARFGTLGIHGVVAQLDDRLRLLGIGRRTALPRHRTLSALLDWSYDLLTDAEQRVLRRCSVFRGGFTLDSASAVAGDAGMDAADVSTCLLALVAKSLVIADLKQALPFYRLLEITRAYACEKLHGDPEEAAMFARHAHHMVALMAQCEQDWEWMARARWMQTYLPTAGNLRAALDWAFGPGGDLGVGVRLTAAIMLPTVQFVREDEMRARARQAYAAIERGAEVEPLHEMRIRTTAAHIASPGSVGPPEDGCYGLALASAERAGRHKDQIEVLYHLFARSCNAGDYRGAGLYAGRAAAVAELIDDPASLLHADRLRCQAAQFLGQHADAMRLAARVVERAGELIPLRYASPVDRRVSVRIVLARGLWFDGRGVQASALAETCVAIAAQTDHPSSMAHALCFAAIPIALWRGEMARAQALTAQLAAHAERFSMMYWLTWAEHYQQLVARAQRGDAMATAHAAPADDMQTDHLATFAHGVITARALARVDDGVVGWCAPEVLRVHGEQLRAAGGAQAEARAQRLFERALALAGQQQARAWALRCADSLARLWQAQGRLGEARKVLAPQVQAFGWNDSAADVRAARALLAELVHGA